MTYRSCRRCGCILADGEGAIAKHQAAAHRDYCPYSSADLQRRLIDNAARIERSMPWRHP